MNPKSSFPPRVRRPIPEATIKAVRERSGNRCEDCGCGGPLENHHLTYLYDPGPPYDEHNCDGRALIFGHENPQDLALLCRECHKHRHIDLNGEFWADIDEMNDHWDSFHEAMDKDD